MPQRDTYDYEGDTPFEPSSLVECGADPFFSLQCQRFLGTAKCLLIEPDPVCCAELRARLHTHSHVRIESCAIGVANCQTDLIVHGNGWSHLKGVMSPAVSTAYRKKPPQQVVRVPVRTFDELDPGDLEWAMLDMEGAEWYLLNCMQSRPVLITLEMDGNYLRDSELSGGLPGYRNPYYQQISDWLDYNGYVQVYRCDNDIGYALRDLAPVYDWRGFARSNHEAKLAVCRDEGIEIADVVPR